MPDPQDQIPGPYCRTYGARVNSGQPTYAKPERGASRIPVSLVPRLAPYVAKAAVMNNDIKLTKRGWVVVGVSIAAASFIVNAVLAHWTWYGGFQ